MNRMRNHPTEGVLVFLVAVFLAGCATSAPPARLVTDREAIRGCELVTLVRDSDAYDLRGKAAEEGGNVVLVTGQVGNDIRFIAQLSRVKYVGEVYRCP